MEQTFQINIISKKNSTWQGALITEHGTVMFQSELELLGEIGRLMDKGKESTTRWDKVEK